MKIILINGSPRAKGCTFTALDQVASILSSQGGECEIVHIGTRPTRGCTACYNCKKTGSGYCVFKDDMVNGVIDKIRQADALIIGSPVYYAAMSGELKSLLDRVFFAGGSTFAHKLGASIVSCRRGGGSSTFDQLNHYFTISNMHIVGSQYWNIVHGQLPQEVLRDEEGMQNLRNLGRNMIWLQQSIEAGRKAGLVPPVAEPRTATNFITPQ